MSRTLRPRKTPESTPAFGVNTCKYKTPYTISTIYTIVRESDVINPKLRAPDKNGRVNFVNFFETKTL